VSDAKKWTTEFYEDDAGRRPVELRMSSLTLAEFAALRAGIVRFLSVHGIDLGSTPWLKALGDGLFEFRVRHDASTIEGLAGHEPAEGLPTQKKILLRLFVHFHGDKVILLLHGYDKGANDSQRQQNKEIQKPASA
jgi:putative component of toxin-antitoxin plasmid stabilization module